ncbi:MAG TPA: 3-dehydroquinate synthase family protein [Candidatus Baltobacteraceae bacterium]|jgi:3-dehydroquinate synthetase|nr:3-dehydroquinate synthase family protein [Candidatus Baltobacteraceae bacterium]
MVSSQEHYPGIIVQGSVREPLRAFLDQRGIDRITIVCDANLAQRARELARPLGSRVRGVLAFPLGERRKTLRTVEHVLDGLMRCGADRGTTIVGVGGGVASDLFGFASSIFMRGVPYIHVATSLVAMVDAAIGGKTGVDLASGKNLAGTFRDPLAVFAWIDALQTLPYRHLREGLAETVKAAIIEGGEYFESLETLAPHAFWRWPWENVVAQAQRIKMAIVNDDREEHGIREVLNLGHTFGHAIERASNYRVTHGAGVSIGLRAAGILALRTGRFSREEHLRVLTLLTLLGLPLATSESVSSILTAMQADKKKRDGVLRFVLPRAIGDVEYGIAVWPRIVRTALTRLRLPPGNREFH